ncbi:MAG: hypothetical protein ACK53V_09595, partial [Planctomycetota bacterium]
LSPFPKVELPKTRLRRRFVLWFRTRESPGRRPVTLGGHAAVVAALTACIQAVTFLTFRAIVTMVGTGGDSFRAHAAAVFRPLA